MTERASHIGERYASLVATVGRAADSFAFAAPPDWVELRADLAGDVPPFASATSLYTLRGVVAERRERLLRAAATFDLIDLEPADLNDALLLQRIASERRVITWRGHARTIDDLDTAMHTIRRVPARLYRIEVQTARSSETLLPMALLKREQDRVKRLEGQLGSPVIDNLK